MLTGLCPSLRSLDLVLEIPENWPQLVNFCICRAALVARRIQLSMVVSAHLQRCHSHQSSGIIVQILAVFIAEIKIQYAYKNCGRDKNDSCKPDNDSGFDTDKTFGVGHSGIFLSGVRVEYIRARVPGHLCAAKDARRLFPPGCLRRVPSKGLTPHHCDWTQSRHQNWI